MKCKKCGFEGPLSKYNWEIRCKKCTDLIPIQEQLESFSDKEKVRSVKCVCGYKISLKRRGLDFQIRCPICKTLIESMRRVTRKKPSGEWPRWITAPLGSDKHKGGLDWRKVKWK